MKYASRFLLGFLIVSLVVSLFVFEFEFVATVKSLNFQIIHISRGGGV